MISEQEICAIKENVNFPILASEYGVDLKVKGSNHFGNCPFHEDKTASLSISKGLYNCFGCGAKGDVISFVQGMESLEFREAVEKLSLRPLQPSSVTEAQVPEKRTCTLNSVDRSKLLTDVFKSLSSKFLESGEAQGYLADSRGVVLSNSDKENLVGFCPSDFASKLDTETRSMLIEVGFLNDYGKPLFKDCLVFALRDLNGQIQSLYGRRIKDSDTNNHIYLPGERKGLFSLGALATEQSRSLDCETVYICESILDGLALYSKGFKGVLSLFGVNGFSPLHEEFLKAHKVKSVVLVLDGDRAGREASFRLKSKLKELEIESYIVELPKDEDPCSFLASKPEHTIWLKDEVSRLMPSLNSDLVITGNLEELKCEGQNLIYSFKGLSLVGMDRLKLTLKVHLKNNPQSFVIDTIDFYKRAMLERFKESVSSDLKLSEKELYTELKSLIPLLESKRLELKEVEEVDSDKVVLSVDEKAEAIRNLKDKDLVKNLIADFESCGIIGEDKGKLLGFLGTISRFLPKPLGVLIISRSGAGKTMLQESFCNFVPPEDLNQYTRISEKVLYYKGEEGLKHKVLALEEEEGMDDAAYAIRTLQSSQKLTSSITRNDNKTGKMVADEYTVNGPVFIAIASTSPDSLDYETRNRFIIVTIDESNAQTANIIDGIRDSYTLEGIRRQAQYEVLFKKYQNMQRQIKPLAVLNPYVKYLKYSCDRLQMRREFHKYMTLINTVALFHQYQREIKHDSIGGDYIEVTPNDIAIANELVIEFFPNSTDELAPHTRTFLEILTEMVKENGGDAHFTRRQAREFSTWSNYSMIKALEQLEELEYVSQLSGRNGKVMKYELMVDANDSKRASVLLTDAKDLEKMLQEANK